MDVFSNDSSVRLNCSELEVSSLTNRLQVGYQLISMVLGLPLNFSCIWRLVRSLQFGDSRVLRLHLLLSCSNVLILIVHCGGYTGWLIAFWFAGGDLICRTFAFLHASVFYLSSNALVAIALDLFCSVRFPLATLRNGRVRVSVSIWICIAASVGSALPQIFFWGLDEVICDETGERRAQCSFAERDVTLMTAYSISHVVVLFWMPLGLIAPIYVSVCYEVFKHYRSNSGGGGDASLQGQLNCDVLPLRRSFGSGGRRANASRRRIILTSLAIVTLYIFSWTPYQVSSIVQLIDIGVLPLLQSLEALMILGAVVNPILYGLIDGRSRHTKALRIPQCGSRRGSFMPTDASRNTIRSQQTDLTLLRPELFG